MTAIMDDNERKFDFNADAYLIRNNQLHADALATTGMRLNPLGGGSQGDSSEPAGKVYKFKNIHGDRGTFAGLSSQAQN